VAALGFGDVEIGGLILGGVKFVFESDVGVENGVYFERGRGGGGIFQRRRRDGGGGLGGNVGGGGGIGGRGLRFFPQIQGQDGVLFVGEVINGVIVATGFEVNFAHLGDEVCVTKHVRTFAEDAEHLVPGFEVKLFCGVSHTFLVIDLGPGLDAQEGIVGGDMADINVVDVVGADDAKVVFGGEFEEFGDKGDLLREAVIHDFDEVIFTPEDVEEAVEGGLGTAPVISKECLRDNALHAPGKTD
jgi:hypothetical protein